MQIFKRKKKIFRSATTTLIISNEKLYDIMKTVMFLEDAGLLIKRVSEKKLKMKQKNKKEEILVMLLQSVTKYL